MQKSTYYEFNMPERADQYNLDKWNENTEKFDRLIHQNEINIDANIVSIRNIVSNLTENNVADTDSIYFKLMDLIYPIGSLYWSGRNVNPSTLFGGSWVQIKNRFVLSAGDTYTAGNTGGSATVTLAVGNLPSHTHSFTPSGTVSAHAHYYTPAGSVVANTITINKGTNNAGSGSNGGYYGDNMSNLTTVSVGSHSHTFSGTRKTTENATPTFTGTAGTTGGGNGTSAPISIMPPYVVKYCWERIA